MTGDLRLATPADVGELEVLVRDAVLRLLPAFHAPALLEAALGRHFGVDGDLIADQTYYLVEDDGRIVACGGWSKRRRTFGEAADPTGDELLDPATEPAQIRGFFVHPDFTRRGLGGRLVRACEDAIAAAGFTRVRIPATTAGELLYARHGYEVYDRAELAVDGGATLPVVWMRKTLAALDGNG